jgi:hypothetical protein
VNVSASSLIRSVGMAGRNRACWHHGEQTLVGLAVLPSALRRTNALRTDLRGRRSFRFASVRSRGGYNPPRALLAQLAEHLHGKEGVDGSSPSEGFDK